MRLVCGWVGKISHLPRPTRETFANTTNRTFFNSKYIMAAVGKCRNCGKTVYPLEAASAVGVVFHKGCFKCKTLLVVN